MCASRLSLVHLFSNLAHSNICLVFFIASVVILVSLSCCRHHHFIVLSTHPVRQQSSSSYETIPSSWTSIEVRERENIVRPGYQLSNDMHSMVSLIYLRVSNSEDLFFVKMENRSDFNETTHLCVPRHKS
jgi:hypothetical protein